MSSLSYESYIKSVKGHILPPEEETRLAKIYASKSEGWEEAHELILKSCLLFVVKAAFEFSTDPHKVCELISEGNMALLDCVERYDPDRGFKLISYAAKEIRGRMIKHIVRYSTFSSFHVSTRDRDNCKRVKDFISSFNLDNHRKPTSEEVQKHFGFSKFYADLYVEMAESQFSSINGTINFENEDSLIDLPDLDAPDPVIESSRTDIIKVIQSIVDNLPERQRIILSKRFGLNGEQETNLDAIGEQFQLCKERIRQIENDALRKVKKEMERLQA